MLFKIGDAQSGSTAADIQIAGDDEVTVQGTGDVFLGFTTGRWTSTASR
jgi:hypothetical protein